MPVWATGQLFWQSESVLHWGMHVGPASGIEEPVVLPLTALPPAPPLPPFPPPDVTPLVLDAAVAPPTPPLLKSGESEPLAQAAIDPPEARTRTRTLRLAYFTGLW